MDLHGQIMNISDKVTENKNAMAGNAAFVAYKEGHRDARHAAAELALKADVCIDALRAIVEQQRTMLFDGSPSDDVMQSAREALAALNGRVLVSG